MSNLYSTLCVVRNSLLNAFGTKYLEGGKPLNVNRILNQIADDLTAYIDIVNDLENLSIEELHDLGFSYIDDDSDLVLFPIWIYPLLPEGTQLINSNRELVVVGIDTVNIHNDHWLDLGFIH